MQQSVLKQYMQLNSNPPLRIISRDTGIQMTRVFRLFNGSSMKICEYQAFRSAINNKLQMDDDLTAIAGQCLENLSVNGISEIYELMNRKLKIKRMVG